MRKISDIIVVSTEKRRFLMPSLRYAALLVRNPDPSLSRTFYLFGPVLTVDLGNTTVSVEVDVVPVLGSM